MSRWADEHGFSAITVSEHHGVDFISAPTTLAGVILGATKHAHVMINALLLPLHDPVRLAEAVATLDLVSGGRFTFVAGLGYRHEEFAMAGADRTRRGATSEEYLDVLGKAWTGEPFEWQGRTITVTPTPVSPREQLVWAGGSVRACRPSVRRASGFRSSRCPRILRSATCTARRAHVSGTRACSWRRTGRCSSTWPRTRSRRGRRSRPYAVYDVVSYVSWQTGDHDNVASSDATTADELRASGMWMIVTPDECVELARRARNGRVAPAHGRDATGDRVERLELFVDQVMPRL